MEIGLLLPTTSRGKGLAKPSQILATARKADELGFHSLWVFDHVAFPHRMLESLTTLSAVASATNRIKLGTSILIAPIRNPLVLAKEASTLDYLSSGRLILGLGTGGGLEQLSAWSQSYSERTGRLEETVNVLKAAWTKPKASFHGRYYSFKDVSMDPKPVQKPHPPLWLGGRSTSSLKRAAETSQGYVACFTTPEEFRLRREVILHYKSRLEDFSFANVIFSHIADNEDQAWHESESFLTKFFNRKRETLEGFNAVGAPEQCSDLINRYRDAGVNVLVLAPISFDLDQLDKIHSIINL
ncbi:MAG: LLM class flavin-dependent oxidoreductase [Thaumarchaeota archaeon]|nr:LLM class flavin-dependent oxidoreductase [Nitrososphaerota archaeon]